MTAEDVPQISDSVMTTLLQIFSTSTHESGGVQQDALMAVSTLVEMLGEGFLKYMDAFKPYLCLGLKNHAEHEVSIYPELCNLTYSICLLKATALSCRWTGLR